MANLTKCFDMNSPMMGTIHAGQELGGEGSRGRSTVVIVTIIAFHTLQAPQVGAYPPFTLIVTSPS